MTATTRNAQPANFDDLYPVGEKQPEQVRTRSGRPLADLTLDNLLAGELTAGDFTITADGLRRQAEIAELAGRPHLGQNLRRGAELVAVPEAELLAVYEQLRPGRAHSAAELRATAARVRQDYGAEAIATLIEEAASAYERRGVFNRRA
jgi:propanediol dehydratase small subunit